MLDESSESANGNLACALITVPSVQVPASSEVRQRQGEVASRDLRPFLRPVAAIGCDAPRQPSAES